MTTKKRQIDPLHQTIELLDRVVTQAQVTQFQLLTITRRLDALERYALPKPKPARPTRKARE